MESTVAVKRLDRTRGQGYREFKMEIQMLSCCRHANIISLVGFCEEKQENILIYELAIHGSLEKHLSNDKLSWMQRLKISLGAARGFSYLHNDVGTEYRILHRDIKSANILLNENWEAKISDFGLSKAALSEVEFSTLVTNACGTKGYIDPQYMETGTLTNESDVYSFGVLLFEILCGRPVVVATYHDRRRFLVSLAKKSWEQKTLHEIILPSIKNEIEKNSLNIFSKVAYQCLKENRSERPTMASIVQKLEEALEYQDPQTRAGKAKGAPIYSQHDNVDALIKCVMKNIGFSEGKPVAAFTIYKCLIHWKTLEAEKTIVFDRLLQMIGSAIESHYTNQDMMAYWLSNASTLLFLLQTRIKPDRANSPPTSPLGRMTMGFDPSPPSVNLAVAAAGLEIVHQVEAKQPALIFKQQLIACVEKMYGIFHDNLKKELGSSLTLCIQAPRASKGMPRSNHWPSIIDRLNTLLNTLNENFVPPIIVQKIFTQIFSYINVQLFNSLLVSRERCTFSNGEYVKAGLAELELWCSQAKEEYAGSAWDELKHIRQAIGFLVIHQKIKKRYKEISDDLCPNLSVQQLYRMCTLYRDDKYKTHGVSPDVIHEMKILMANDPKNSFLLNESTSMPFSVDDLSGPLQVKEFTNVKYAVELAEYPAFQFLYE